MKKIQAMRFGFFDSDGLKLRYFECGEGEPLILIHGLGDCIEGWTFQYDDFSKHFRVVALDLRGFGMSDVPESISVEDFARDVKNLIDHLGIERANLLGLSMGGVVCMEFYRQYPEMVKSLVLANTLHKLPDAGRAMFEQRLKLLESSPDMTQIAEFIAEMSIHQDRPELKELVKTIIRKNNKEFYTKVTAELGRINYEDLLPKIEVPTLVITAEFDVTTPPALGREIASLIPKCDIPN
ncbi:2-hydroxy-6-oxo-6-phenylhexa-2,4-dienoic acid hydrolase (pcbD) [Archaeoglobus fulgidus DSM 4304]|uniref:2-hydroxy-6-oxo-6-phenylhexa-2,4-dienoic acid hydrolase (PcbD) n=3 Tax=Archaeoglobus fulgidus TaxID=2234 RepID=O28567_ARCFU|nr:2-hydroxy-6-oxo-6-phenylhexa-2,4-dienoic acid hydrolase (pcbD) [Archaeoglobus fulgidus DSM 4304]